MTRNRIRIHRNEFNTSRMIYYIMIFRSSVLLLLLLLLILFLFPSFLSLSFHLLRYVFVTRASYVNVLHFGCVFVCVCECVCVCWGACVKCNQANGKYMKGLHVFKIIFLILPEQSIHKSISGKNVLFLMLTMLSGSNQRSASNICNDFVIASSFRHVSRNSSMVITPS